MTIKPPLFSALLIASAAVLGTNGARAAPLLLAIDGAADTGGDIQAALCTREEFKTLTCSRSARGAVRDHTAQVRFDVPPGEYAGIVFHDRFSDGRVHRSFLGIPRQGVGFTRNPVLVRAPTFEQVAIDIPPEGSSLEIRLRFEAGK